MCKNVKEIFDFVWFSFKFNLESSFLTLEPAVCSRWKSEDECGQTLFSLRLHSELCNNRSVGFILHIPAVFRRAESFHSRSRGVIWWMLHHRMNRWWGWSHEEHVPCSGVSLCDILSFTVTHGELFCFWINKLSISEGSQSSESGQHKAFLWSWKHFVKREKPEERFRLSQRHTVWWMERCRPSCEAWRCRAGNIF